MGASDPLAVRCAVCHVAAGEPCREIREHVGPALPYPHRGRDGTDVRDRGTCEIGWYNNSTVRAGSHDCSLDDGHVSRTAHLDGAVAFAPEISTDHVCRCGDRFSHAAAVGMSS